MKAMKTGTEASWCTRVQQLWTDCSFSVGVCQIYERCRHQEGGVMLECWQVNLLLVSRVAFSLTTKNWIHKLSFLYVILVTCSCLLMLMLYCLLLSFFFRLVPFATMLFVQDTDMTTAAALLNWSAMLPVDNHSKTLKLFVVQYEQHDLGEDFFDMCNFAELLKRVECIPNLVTFQCMNHLRKSSGPVKPAGWETVISIEYLPFTVFREKGRNFSWKMCAHSLVDQYI